MKKDRNGDNMAHKAGLSNYVEVSLQVCRAFGNMDISLEDREKARLEYLSGVSNKEIKKKYGVVIDDFGVVSSGKKLNLVGKIKKIFRRRFLKWLMLARR